MTPSPLLRSMRTHRAALTAILLVAALVRLWGLDWGLPRVDLNPDELNVLQVTQRISWESPDPGFYNYSGLSFHLNFLAAEGARALGLEVGAQEQLWINRLWSVLWGTATVAVIYLAGRMLWSRRRPALLAAGALAILPLHVWDSHFGVTDIPLTFWCALAFLLSLVAYRIPNWRNFLVGGLAVGFAIGTKFSGAVVGSAFIGAAALVAWERRSGPLQAFAMLCGAGAASLVGFFASSPFSVLNWRATRDAFLYETRHVSGGHFGFDVSAEGWQYHRGTYQLAAAFPFSFGVALYAALVVGLVWFVWRARTAERGLLLLYPLLYVAVNASWIFVPIRYYLPIAGMLLLAAAWSWDRALERRPRLAGFALLLVFGYTLAFTLSTTARFQSDTRTEAGEWGETRLPPEARVWYGEPVFGASYMPRFTERSDIEVGSVPLERLAMLRGPMRRSPGNGFLVLSSLTFMRSYRQGDPEQIALWEQIRNEPRRFELLESFDDGYLNKRFYSWLDPMFAGYFVSPRIEVYRVPQPPPPRRRSTSSPESSDDAVSGGSDRSQPLPPPR